MGKRFVQSRPPERTIPSRNSLNSLYLGQLATNPSVVGSFIGYRRRSGRIEREIALVILVRQKRPIRSIPPSERIPKSVVWEVRPDGRQRRLPTDVREWRQDDDFPHFHSICGPGDFVADPIRASVGMAVDHPEFGAVITTAGHSVMEGAGERDWDPGEFVVTVSLDAGATPIKAEVRRAIRSQTSDYAILTPVDGQALNLFRDRWQVADPYDPDESDLHRNVWVLSAAGTRAAKLRGINARAEIKVVGEMTGLLLTDPVTYGGDSGAVLVDEQWRCLGTVVGLGYTNEGRFSMFMPASQLITNEKAIWR